MTELCAAGRRKAGVDRRLLKLGTVLGSSAAAVALLVPAAAFANLPARPPSSGGATSTGGSPAPLVALLQPAAAFQVDRADLLQQIKQITSAQSLGSFAAAGPILQNLTVSTPQDLTVRHPTRFTATFGGGTATYSYGDITTTTDNTPGVITHYAGATTITAGNITTSGDFSDGVSANGPYVSGQTGQISINVGNVSTSGINSNGIYAANANGGIAITAGSISTTGAGAIGIYTRSVGDTVIKTGDINASGNGVEAVGAGQMSITVGNVSSGLTGISALAGGNVNITAASVSSASGSGIIAASGQFGTYYQAPTGGNITITTGHVAGGGGDGIYARTFGAGAINITADVVSAIGPGIYAKSGSPGGLYSQNGPGSNSIYRGLTVGGSVAVTADSVSTVADKSVGIFAVGGSAEVTVSQAVTTQGNQSSGIVAISYDGDAIVHSNGSVQTHGGQSAGIYAYAGIPISEWGQPIHGNVTIDGGGDVTTYGPFSSGIVAKAWTSGGSVSITAGKVQTNGAYSAGISVLTSDFGFDKQVSNITVDVQSVTTSGDKAPGIQLIDGAPVVFGWSVANGGQVDVNVHDSVSTRGYSSPAIAVVGYNNDVNISVANNLTTRDNASDGVTVMGNNVTLGVGGTISTQGDRASGVIIYGGGDVQITTSTVQTAGDGAHGIVAITPSASSLLCEHYIGCSSGGGAVTISAGSITTAGKKSFGIYAAGYSGVTANVGSIATQGDDSTALIAKAFSGPISITETGGITTQGKLALGVSATDQNGPIDLTLTGAIATKGDFSAGVVAAAYNGPVNVQAGSITTTGANANALAAYSFIGSTTVNLGTASTAGIKAAAVFVEGQTGVTLTANQISTSGDDANALIIRSGGYGVIGNATVNVGAITTTGQHSAGVDAFTVGQSSGQASTLSLTVGSITTTGIDSPGISAINSYGAININAAKIATQGYESTGVLTFGGGDINIQAGSITTAKADAIEAYGSGSGTITVGVTGNLASSGASGVVAINAGGATSVTVGSNGSVAGAVDAIQVQTGGGPVTVANAGTITGGSGFAINVTPLSQTASAGTQIDNTGTIVGAVNLTGGGNNTLTNAGTFVATKDSDFGGGLSQFVNTGVLKVGAGASAAGTVNFLNLATFENAGGLIDLRGAPAGEVFVLSGDYVASGNARLGIGVNGNSADKLVIGGVATGATTILLNANPASATLLARPLTVVQAGAGSTGTFTLGTPNVGLIHYGLQDPAGVSYNLTASAGAPVYGMLKLEESAQTIWRQSADAWSEHLAALRGDAWNGGQGSSSGASSGYGLGSGRYWVQAYGSTSDRNQNVAAGYGSVSTNYNQTDAGVQAGADLASTATKLGNVGWGVTAGYTSSQIDALGGTLKSDVDSFNVGGYAVLNHGPYFANGLVKVDHHQISTTDSVAGYQANLNGNSYGAQFEVGRHFGSERFAFEPTVSLTYVRTSLDNVSIDSQTLAFDDEDGVSGKIGGRFYANRTFHGTSFVFYAGAAAVDDFTGSQRATFYSGGTSQNVSTDGEGAYAQAVAGVSARTVRNITLYLEGDANFGGDHSGAGVRLGARF